MRLLLVGLGRWGRFWASRALPRLPQVELAGCVDHDPRALAFAREALGLPSARCFGSLDAALAVTKADVALVTTTLEGHVPVARAALVAGMHVLVEKPLAPSLAQARALVELARARGRVLMVSQNYRFFPAVRAVVDLVRSGRLGAPHEVEIDFRHRSPVADEAGRTGHRLLRQPLLMDMSIHHFDLLRLILGREPTWICCQAWNRPGSGFDGPPTSVATIRFGDLVVSYRGSWLTWAGDTNWAGEWRMTFERGEVWWTSRGLAASEAGDLVVVRRPGGDEERVALPALQFVDQAGSLAELIDAVHDGREPESSGRENLGSLALTLAAVESAERGAAISL